MRIHKNIVVQFFFVVLSFCAVSCRQDAGVDQPEVIVPEEKVDGKVPLEVHVTMQQPVTKAFDSGEWLDLSSSVDDDISLSVSRLEEPMDVDVPMTKGSSLLTSLPSSLWFNIIDGDDGVSSNDYIVNTGDNWYTGDGYFLGTGHDYEFYVSNFDPDLTSPVRNVSPDVKFNDCVSKGEYSAYTRDDIVGYYYRRAGDTGGDYDIQMYHIYSAVFFEFSGVGPTGAVIQSVSLKNIKRSGIMGFGESGVTWSSSGSVSDVVNNIDYVITNGTSYDFSSICPIYVPASAITSTSVLEVKLSYLDQVFTLTQVLVGDTWKAGYKYTYRFGFNGFTNSSNYSLEILPSDPSIDVGDTQTYVASLVLNYGGGSYLVLSNVSDVVWSSLLTSVAERVSSTDYSSGSTSAVFRGVSSGTTYISCQCTYEGNTYYSVPVELEVNDVIEQRYILRLFYDNVETSVLNLENLTRYYVSEYSSNSTIKCISVLPYLATYVNGVYSSSTRVCSVGYWSNSSDDDSIVRLSTNVSVQSSNYSNDYIFGNVWTYAMTDDEPVYLHFRFQSNGQSHAGSSYSPAPANTVMTLDVPVYVGAVESYVVASGPYDSEITVGGSTVLKAYLYKTVNGVMTGSPITASTSCTWDYYNGDSYTSLSDTGLSGNAYTCSVTGVAAGTSRIQAKITYNGSTYTTGLYVINVVNTDITYTYDDDLTITPSNRTITVNDTQTYTATITRHSWQNGSVIKSESVDVTSSASWTASPASVATMSGNVATGVGAGTATISASYEGKSATTNLTVQNGEVSYTYENLVIAPANPTIYVNGTQSFTATCTRKTWQNGAVIATDNNYSCTDGCTWTSGTTSVATMSGATATGVSAGTSTIRATHPSSSNGSGTITATTTLTVQNGEVSYTYENLVVAPTSPTIYVNGTQSFTATCTRKTWQDGAVIATDNNYSCTDGCTWTSGTTSVATMSGATATGVSAGTSTIRATHPSSSNGSGTITATTTLTVQDVVTHSYSIELLPKTATITVGASQEYEVKFKDITYTNGVQTNESTSDVTGPSTLSSSNTTVATVANEFAYGHASGTVTITASYTYSGTTYTDTATLTVSPSPYTYELVISPDDAVIGVGGTQVYVAKFITYYNGSKQNESTVTTSCTWTSSDTAVATMSGKTATGVSFGVTTVSARYTYQGTVYTDTTTLIVSSEIGVDPSDPGGNGSGGGGEY